MNKSLVFAACAIAFIGLTGQTCSTTPKQQIYYKTKYVVPDVPEELFECPTVSQLPNPATLTESQVARLLVMYHKYGKKCKGNMVAIKKYLDDAKRTVASRNR